MLRLAFDFIITWRETRTRPNAYRGIRVFIRLVKDTCTACCCLSIRGVGYGVCLFLSDMF